MTTSKEETSAPVLHEAETLEEVIDCLTEHLEIPMQGACDQKTLFEILVRAASQSESVEQTCNTLEDVTAACQAAIRGEAPPSLLPRETLLGELPHEA